MPRRGATWQVGQLVLRIACLMVPPGQRAAWLEEWRSELWHESDSGTVRKALGSVRDAFAVRRLSRTRVPGTGNIEDDSIAISERVGTMMKELRVALRSLLRTPEYTGVAVLTLALGIGGSTSIFTLLDRVVLDPLPYPDSSRLVRLTNAVPCVGEDTRWGMATGQYVHYGDNARSLASIGAYQLGGANISTPDGAERIRVARVSASMMTLLGAEASAGRLIGPEDDLPGADDVAILSYAFWTGRYVGDTTLLGRTISLDDRPHLVIGVATPGLALPESRGDTEPQVWTALRINRLGPHRNHHVIPMIARLAPEFDATASQAELDQLRHQLPEVFPTAYSKGFIEECGFRTLVLPLKDDVVGDMATNLWILFGAVGLVLIIACANAANLFLVRLDGRKRELAIRQALGAGRLTLLRHVLAESLALGLAAGALAALITFLALPPLIRTAPQSLPRVDSIQLGWNGVGFTLILSLVVAIVLALVPTSLLRGASDTASLKEGSRGSGAGKEGQRLRAGLVIAQVALALTLVVGASLMLESLRHLARVDPGFDPTGVITARIDLTPSRYPNDLEAWGLYKELLDRVRIIPGVEAAGLSEELPLGGGFGCTVQGFADPAVWDRLEQVGVSACAGQEQTTPGYFAAMGIPLLRGRTFEDADNDDPGRGTVVVSQAFAERFWGDQDPIGRQVGPSGTDDPLYTVVGVVGDVPVHSLAGPKAVAIYYPVRWIPPTRIQRPGTMTLVVRSARSESSSVMGEVRSAMAQIDPSIPLASVREMEELVDISMARVAFTSILLEIAAAVALLLAAIGLYGVISYIVGRRTREIGMRMVLGANPGQVERQIVQQSLILAGSGLILGTALSAVSTRVLEGLLVGVAPTSPVAYGAALALLALVAAVASWIPARRAARIDPSEALRAE